METNEEALMEMVHRTAGYMIGAAVVAGIQLGERLGIYEHLATTDDITSNQLAQAVGCNPRLIREWLDGQVAAGLITLDPTADTYELSAEAAMVLADTTSPVFLAKGMQSFASMTLDMDKIEAAYRGDGGMAWAEHHPCLFDGVEWFFRTGYRTHLAAEWIPALEGTEERLKAGAKVLDVGCGHGASLVVLAEAYPESTFKGVDFHPPSIEVARQQAEEAGVNDRCSFELADAQGYEGTYDLIAFFDCLHDMGDPVGAARHALSRLTAEGSVLLVEPFAHNSRVDNIANNPFAPLLYHASSMICTPNSLSQNVGLGLGAQAGEDRLRDVFEEAGYSGLERRTETPFNLILQAKP